MNQIRTDIPRRTPDEAGDAYATRLYLALGEGEIAAGWRRRGEALEHVGEALEYLEAFDEVTP